MTFFSQRHNIPCYALSLRGHGGSFYPSFLRMLYATFKSDLADDLVAGIEFAERRERETGAEDGRVVLVGHSSGGGLSQDVLSRGRVRVRGLVLAAAVPGYGSMGVYTNWWALDPWFSLRMLLHGWHPKSPLSSTALVKRVFFCNEMPESRVQEFEKQMSMYESFWWPVGMMYHFASATAVMSSIVGWGAGKGERLLVLAGEKDVLMTKDVMEKLAEFYRGGFEELVRGKKIEAEAEEVRVKKGGRSRGLGVRLATVEGAGHHLQNDLQWEDGAEQVLEFYRQL
ncbi:hypothetical protein W97_00136 [Coniosporium apollinis CBS 100218]|uniref:AB hydrolase-1 domain-containing protein n=1 Tax=Coniosporium apollinis (strain CBS 100218) TaxID=1168221 RepID=R7YGY9_CONA1|nr:uncharacterized protein W97_00136 [Coniosporium apollinis CBS 100218]EON60926.1 hypothetical protein W97_00136 [Coniosporium apollinis CBS 100218]